MTTADKQALFNVTGASSGVPAWFASQTDGTWKAIADGSGTSGTGGAKIISVQASGCNIPPGTQGWTWNNTFANGITNSWTSACFDTQFNEYVFWCNGGHSDYAGNEAYALALLTATPGWRRLYEPTQTADIISQNLTSGGNGKYGDGRARSMHNSFQTYGDGRFWAGYMNSVTSADGGGATVPVSFNRAALGPAATPVPYASADKWAFHTFPAGVSAGSSTLKFGSGTYDKVGKKAWFAAGEGANNTPFWSIDTDPAGSPGATVGYQTNQNGFGNIFGMAVAHDINPRIIVGTCTFSNRIGYVNLSNPAAGWVIPTNFTGTQPQLGVLGAYSTTNQNMSIQYDAASKSFVLSDPTRFGRTLYQLRVPLTGTTLNAAGQWTWSSATPAGPTLAFNPNGSLLVYQKVQYVPDMGNGQAALVYCGDVNGSTYVYKIPPGGLNL